MNPFFWGQCQEGTATITMNCSCYEITTHTPHHPKNLPPSNPSQWLPHSPRPEAPIAFVQKDLMGTSDTFLKLDTPIHKDNGFKGVHTSTKAISSGLMSGISGRGARGWSFRPERRSNSSLHHQLVLSATVG